MFGQKPDYRFIRTSFNRWRVNANAVGPIRHLFDGLLTGIRFDDQADFHLKVESATTDRF